MDVSLPILAFYHRVCAHDGYIPEVQKRSNTRISNTVLIAASNGLFELGSDPVSTNIQCDFDWRSTV